MEYYYGHFLNFSNGTYTLKNFAANLSVFLSVLFIIFVIGNKIKKEFLVLSFLILLLTTFFYLKIIYTKEEKYQDENTIWVFLITIFYNFFFELLFFSIISLLTLLCPNNIEATFIGIIDLVNDVGYQLSSVFSNIFIRLLKLDPVNNYQNLQILVVLHILFLFIPLFLVINFKFPVVEDIHNTLEKSDMDFDPEIFEETNEDEKKIFNFY